MKLRLRKAKPKATLVDARAAFQAQVDYWETRMFYGDPLFDQWMVDALEESRKGLAVLDRMEEVGATTGKEKIVSTTPTFYATVKVKIEHAYKDRWTPTYVLNGQASISFGQITADSKEEAYELARAKLIDREPKKVKAATVFSLARGK